MGEIDELRYRVESSRRDYAALPRMGWGQPGPPDEETGERWDRSNVLGHVAELVPFWTAQVRLVLNGAESIGRDPMANAMRRTAIDTARDENEDDLLATIDTGMEGLVALLSDMRDEDLERPAVFRTSSGGERRGDLRQALHDVLIDHLEEHLRQLQELATQG
jgi:hypothetical protein